MASLSRLTRHSRRARLGGRSLRAAALAAALSLALVGCGTSTVSLEELAVEAEDHNGDTVTTHGVVAEFGEAEGAIERHFVLRDADENRVRLLPDEAAEPHVGSAVEVTGAFQYDQTRGRALHIDSIDPASP